MAGLPLKPPAAAAALVDWLHAQTLAGATIPALLAGMCESLDSAGVQLARCVIGVDTLHPTLDGYFFLWRRQSSDVEVVAYSREKAAKEVDKWLRSPFHHLDVVGKPMHRWNVARGEGVNEFPILSDLRAEGVSDYVCFRHRLSDGAIGNLDAVYSSWTTTAAAGFDDSALALLEATVPTLSVAVTTSSYAQIARNLAETYLGRDIGARVLAGEIVRGRAERLEAVIWFSDLAGFTRISDTAPPEAIIPLLNDYAGAVVDAVHGMKGEVLKFIGDGVLALFRSGSAEESCRRALAAVLDLRGRMSELNERRGRDNQPVAGMRLGLHLGDVYFGNIGSADRLDFTAVGPAVNEASRVVAMCRSLDQEILVSSRFAAEAGDARARLVSVGRYALRGVGRPQELFTLDPEIA